MDERNVREQTFALDFDGAFVRCLEDPQFSALKELVDEQINDRLRQFAFALAEANREVNLTAITDPAEMAVKHVADSLLALTVGDWPVNARVCDVGTGGGVPGVVLAIGRPDLAVTLLDSVQKKLRVVGHICSQIGVSVETVHGRAEDLGRAPSLREQFDVVTARAVARLPVLLELCLPFTKVGGFFVALKGPDADEEIRECNRALDQLGGVISSVREISLPLDAGQRTIIEIRKVKTTPRKFPRSPGIPSKRPL